MWSVFGGGGTKEDKSEAAEKSDLGDNPRSTRKPTLLLNRIRKSRKFWRTRSGPSPGLVTRGDILVKEKVHTVDVSPRDPPPTTEKDETNQTSPATPQAPFPSAKTNKITQVVPLLSRTPALSTEKDNEEVDLMEEECSQSLPPKLGDTVSRTSLHSAEQAGSSNSQSNVSAVISQASRKPERESEQSDIEESTLVIENVSKPNNVGGLSEDPVIIGLEQSSNSDPPPGDHINTIPTVPRIDSIESNRIRMIMQILEEENLNIKQLRKYSWRGIPAELRPRAWRHLLGYLPRHRPRAEAVLQRKRAEYQKMVSEYYPKTSYRDPDTDPSIPAILADLVTHTEHEAATFRQISIDVPRTHPKMKLFQLDRIRMCLTRILFIWALRHPATSYVQGFNDLCTAFVYLFLDEQTRLLFNKSLWPTDSEVLNLAGTKVPDGALQNVEADAFWCLNALLEQIQDHYIFGQPAIQQMMFHLEEVIRRIDEPLHNHLVKETGISFLHFSFRWMNCLLLREIRLNLILRLWDTYLSIEDASIAQGFTQFHVFVCAAFLRHFSKQLLKCGSLEESVLLLQNLPTNDWRESDIEEILSEAYLWKETFGLNIQKT